MEVCPTEVIKAPVEHVWGLLSDPQEFARWSGTELDEGPGRPVRAGDRFVLKKIGLRISIQVRDANPPQRLDLQIQLPLGIVNHEQVRLSELSPTTCRVTFN